MSTKPFPVFFLFRVVLVSTGLVGLFYFLLQLQSTDLMLRWGQQLLFDNPSHDLQLAAGRALLLFSFNLLAFLGIGLLMDGRWIRNVRLYFLLLACAVLAAFSPYLANLVSGPVIVRLPWFLQVLAVSVGSGLAQAGLWAETFLVTGMLIDALRRRRPTYYAAERHGRMGLGKGFMYGLLFMLLMQAYGFVSRSSNLLAWLVAHPVLMSMLLGPLLFCLARTIIESFDESPPFIERMLFNFRQPMNHLRGFVFGLGFTGLLLIDTPQATSELRFFYGFLLGALVYAGADLLRDGMAMLRRQRQRLQCGRVYGLGAVMGGLVGGAIAWYFDAAQMTMVMQRLDAYATLNFQASGKAATQYVIYPLFSRWGEMDLGLVQGGARLLFNDSLSGVINWAIAAPLFSVNLVLLTALFERRLRPVRHLLSLDGLTGVVEQTVRVLRWGLWMAPIIQTFLRMAPDPSWYNQDGAIRTGAATVASLAMSAEHFRQWSLDVFLGVLAYEWLRVLIWFDHMGLRVASLVNLSFVGGDRFDEWAARFLGHRARTRSLPGGIRRFATWAPLLLPFYIPRGADWDYAWNGAELLGKNGGDLLPAVSLVLVAYAVAAVLALLAGFFVAHLAKQGKRASGTFKGQKPAKPVTLSNGIYSLHCYREGRNSAHVFSALRKGEELDISRRPKDRLDIKGKFFYVQEITSAASQGPLWSIGQQPVGHRGADYAFSAKLNSVSWRNSHNAIQAEAEVTVAPELTQEIWRIRLFNNSATHRSLLLTTYQEIALNVQDGYERHPDFNAIHVGSCFIKSLNALMVRNRLLQDPVSKRSSSEVAFHAVALPAQAELLGYEDNRQHFIGTGTLSMPAMLSGGLHRPVEDEGLLYSFDPALSLQLRIELPPGASVDIPFIDGYACNEYQAAQRISQFTQQPTPATAAIDAVFAKHRQWQAAQ
ncbi:MAG TPA: hypothetical protein VFV48_08500, partial [Pseudomonadales bacterium]|nr:hypothetical protein [Pseudomonadales bacterium]